MAEGDKVLDLLEEKTVPAVFELGSFDFLGIWAGMPFVHLKEEGFAGEEL
jgi:hypothetical protein